jgi:hypothetical protein
VRQGAETLLGDLLRRPAMPEAVFDERPQLVMLGQLGRPRPFGERLSHAISPDGSIPGCETVSTNLS